MKVSGADDGGVKKIGWFPLPPDDMTRECLEKRENGILYVFYVFQCRWMREQECERKEENRM